MCSSMSELKDCDKKDYWVLKGFVKDGAVEIHLSFNDLRAALFPVIMQELYDIAFDFFIQNLQKEGFAAHPISLTIKRFIQFLENHRIWKDADKRDLDLEIEMAEQGLW